MKKYNLPSLSLLHTFEAVARRLSFTLAADELCLTQSAVSRRIKALESLLGLALFRRKHRAIELTAEGRELLDSVTRSFDAIQSCVTRLRVESDTPQITVSASVAFSYYWLMPRLEAFSERHPDIDLRILATDQMVDLRDGDVDIAVLYGDGEWVGIESHRLFGERVYPVCSPDYLDDHPEISGAVDLLEQPLLHLDGGGNIWGAVDWRAWLASQGVFGRPVRRGIRLNSYPMVLQGAEAGRGVALGWSYITDAMLADGRLVCPVAGPLETPNGYYICASLDAGFTPTVPRVVKWILGEASDPSGAA